MRRAVSAFLFSCRIDERAQAMRQQLFSRAMKEKGLQGFSRCANVWASTKKDTTNA
jgi:hypothetical protein